MKIDLECSENECIRKLEKSAVDIRKSLLKLASYQNIHIGGDLSITDVMTVLWQYQIKYDPKNPSWEYRDRFILSKGHASAVTSLCQASIGCFEESEVIETYAQDESKFSMHSCNIINPYVEISTGSLGHGMPIACGIAAALRLKGNNKSRVYTVMGDGEQAEGSIWEAAMNAVHYKLGNLVAILDYNKIEGDGFISDLTGLENIADKYKCFGWEVIELDGNNIAEIKKAFDNLPDSGGNKPIIFVCHTIKGKGVSYMENTVKWHTGKLSSAEADEAINIIEENYRKKTSYE